MARPTKEGLEYFPLDIDIDQDDKVIIITAKYGMEGFGILIKLLMEIYKNGYYYDWTEKEQIIFSSRVNVDRNIVSDLVNDCIKWGFFNETKFNEYGVLTSKGIQDRYLLATSRRVNVTIKEELKLVSVDINSNLTKKVPAKSTQSKVKEKKVKEKKVKETKIHYAEFVSLTETEYIKLVSEHGETPVKEMIRVLDNYKGANNKKYASDYRAILNWVVDRVKPTKKNENKVSEELGF